MTKPTRHNLMLTLSRDVRQGFSYDGLIAAMLPNGKRGSNQAYIRTCIVDLHQVNFKHMRLTIGEMIDDLKEKFETTNAGVLTCAIAWHTGKHASQLPTGG